jgi:CheY-like chemotaxis protein
VFLDWNMPGMDGIETARCIKGNPHCTSIPLIIMMTAFPRKELLTEADKSNLDAFLTKPVTQSILFDTIMNLFEQDGAKTPQLLQKQVSITTEFEAIRGARILVVEDNAINQQVIQKTIESEGLVVAIANNGQEAVVMVDRKNFDVVLMDIQMPEMDGMEATQLIRTKPQHNKLPIIAMTAHAMSDVREKFLAAGMNDYITKPFDVDDLFNILKKWIDPKRPENPHFSHEVSKNVPLSKKTQPIKFKKLPNHLPGIDAAAGLKRVHGDQFLYAQLLQDFYQEHHETITKISAFLQKGDFQRAQCLTHDLKGTAGNLGVNHLYLALKNLEMALDTGDEFEFFFQQLKEAMTEVMKTLANLNDDEENF